MKTSSVGPAAGWFGDADEDSRVSADRYGSIMHLSGWTMHTPRTRAERTRGLLGRSGLAPNEGLLLRRCRSVHTLGMRFPIDVLLFDGRGRVLRIVAMRPGRLLLPRPRVRHIVEVAAGRGAAFSRALAGSTTLGNSGSGHPLRMSD